jgi:16S rRNA (guanine966-N2)-methyltransferase
VRIISGSARGRRLFSPGQTNRPATIRPTSDRVREALFNIIGEAVIDADVLDLFAGTGALGMEALSRGGRSSIFVDNSQKAIKLIKKNLDCCGFSTQSTIYCRDLLRSSSFLKKITPLEGFDLVFVDPPYRREIAAKTLEQIASHDILAENGLLVVEEDSGVDLPGNSKGLKLTDRRTYGDTAVSFYRKAEVNRDE